MQPVGFRPSARGGLGPATGGGGGAEPMNDRVNLAAVGEPAVHLMPMGDPLLSFFPAEVDGSAIEQRRKIDEPLGRALHQAAEPFEFLDELDQPPGFRLEFSAKIGESGSLADGGDAGLMPGEFQSVAAVEDGAVGGFNVGNDSANQRQRPIRLFEREMSVDGGQRQTLCGEGPRMSQVAAFSAGFLAAAAGAGGSGGLVQTGSVMTFDSITTVGFRVA